MYVQRRERESSISNIISFGFNAKQLDFYQNIYNLNLLTLLLNELNIDELFAVRI